ncbi:hypothetical protein PAXRUDRAFT_822175 [Paxillus rubicundulus Ve08.2h10]|uniref:Uncharacterized protein n=1 Tax=Paxillus rubicundulus Ve08.2h10 TaxID=930991 RepID=A0A0D0ECU7_9AGAM|nr:hypothetical protein PAXRUDRAFT_822175 [Paxillus rubicundulus Ve08.2h10]
MFGSELSATPPVSFKASMCWLDAYERVVLAANAFPPNRDQRIRFLIRTDMQSRHRTPRVMREQIPITDQDAVRLTSGAYSGSTSTGIVPIQLVKPEGFKLQALEAPSCIDQ